MSFFYSQSRRNRGMWLRGLGTPYQYLRIVATRKYPLRDYILIVLTHTTAWDQNWGGDETLKLVLVYVA